MRDIAGVEANAADLENVVPVSEVIFGELQDGLGLEGRNECIAQIEDQSSLEIGVGGLGDEGALFCAFEAEVTLAAALDELTDSGNFEGAGKWLPDAVVGNDLGAIDGKAEVGIRPQEGGDFFCFGFVDVQFVGEQGRVGGFELIANLLPGIALRLRR